MALWHATDASNLLWYPVGKQYSKTQFLMGLQCRDSTILVKSLYIQETGNENKLSTGMLSERDHFNPSIVPIDGFNCTCMVKWYLPTSPSPYPQSPICTAASFRRTIIALQSHILNTHQLRTAHHIPLHLQSARYRQTCNYRPQTAHRDHSAQWHGTCPA